MMAIKEVKNTNGSDTCIVLTPGTPVGGFRLGHRPFHRSERGCEDHDHMVVEGSALALERKAPAERCRAVEAAPGAIQAAEVTP
ncbi:MAG: hypothetical protein HY669_03460 [Chloroflexi bacterium]|nr:hypothetical protein [Chloroflexota bacterium]